ncbi:MAG: cysteine synthase A [Clostridia bacterium]|nr:cysteine synthase A [Clostridia bacterium]
MSRVVTDTVGGTPLVRLQRLSPEGREVWAKLEGRNPGGSVKDRIALAIVEDAEARGLLAPGGVIVEATSGNTGIGLAWVAAARGYRLILTMPEDMSVERRNLLRWLGAELHLTPAIEGMSGAVFAAEELARRPGAFLARQFENPANPLAHYRTTGPEIAEALARAGREPDAFVAAVGTGGTLTGAGRYLKERYGDVPVVAVEPAASAVLSGGRPGFTRILGIGAGFVPGVLDRSLIDRVVAVRDEDAIAWSLRLGKEEGILAGFSSGAAAWAAAQVAASLPRGACVVTILPDTGERYLSMVGLERAGAAS